MSLSLVQALVAEVSKLYPLYAQDPLDTQWNHGNAALQVIGPDGEVGGRLYGTDQEVQARCHQIALRKVVQVWRTGYHTGRFETLVFAGRLDEGHFGLQRPDFIGWEGGVPLVTRDGALVAAAFSGFRGEKDVEIVERAAATVGLAVLRKEP